MRLWKRAFFEHAFSSYILKTANTITAGGPRRPHTQYSPLLTGCTGQYVSSYLVGSIPSTWIRADPAVAESDYNLAAGLYKPRVAEKAPEDDPAELMGKILVLERSIAADLEKLIKEVEATQ